ncbi:MAG: hypothetical protein NTW50_01450 [Candidatus Berkelbacteria bacterium]|nr:hypothetical protein [Candidatus Berkelbacteria bacterium]
MINFLSKAGATGVAICPDGSSSCAGGYDFSSYVQAIYKFSIELGGSLTVLMLVYAGYIYLTSQGDTSKINSAKEILTGTLLGFVLLMSAGLILRFIGLPTS